MAPHGRLLLLMCTCAAALVLGPAPASAINGNGLRVDGPRSKTAPPDRSALLALKRAMSRDGNGTLARWSEAVDPCSGGWPGVGCIEVRSCPYIIPGCPFPGTVRHFGDWWPPVSLVMHSSRNFTISSYDMMARCTRYILICPYTA